MPKATRGFESCSIEPRPQNPQPLLPGRALLPQGQPRKSSNQPKKLKNYRQGFYMDPNSYIVLSDSDDSGNETPKRDHASIASDPDDFGSNIQFACKSQQKKSRHSQPSKRHFEETSEASIRDLEKQTAKHRKFSASASSVLVSREKSFSNPSSPASQLSPPGSSYDHQDDKDKGKRYISEGRYHTLQEWAIERISLEQQNKQNSMESHQVHVRAGGSMLGDTSDLDGRRQRDLTSDISNGIDPTEDTAATSTIGRGDGQTAGCCSHNPSELGNFAIEIRCESASNQQLPAPSPMNSHFGMDTSSYFEGERVIARPPTVQGKTGPLQGMVEHLPTTPLGFAQPQNQTQQRPSISHRRMMTVQTGVQPNLAPQIQQYQPPIYHKHHLPQPPSLALQETYPPVHQASFQTSPSPGCSTPSGYYLQPPQSLEARSAVGLSSPSRVQYPDQSTAPQAFAQPSRPNFQPASFKYAFTEHDIEHLPTDQTKIGDGWFVQYNPQLPRVIDVSILHTLQHESIVSCIGFSPDGNYVATGGNKTVQMFDALSGQRVWALQIDYARISPDDMYIRCLCFSPDGKYLATGSEDMLIRVWDTESKKLLHILTGHQHHIYSLDFASDSCTLATGSADCTVRLWDIEAGLQTMCLNTDANTVGSVAISPDTRHVAAGLHDKSIRIWNTATGLLVEQLKGPNGHTDSVYSVAFSPNGKGLVSGSLDKTVKMWELNVSTGDNSTLGPEDGKCFGTFEDHADFVLSVAMTPDGAWILSGSKDRGVHFSDPHTGRCQLRIRAHRDSVMSVATSPRQTANGGLFATGSCDKEAKIWGYTYVTAQQSSQMRTPGNEESVPNGQPSSQISQQHELQLPSEPQCSQLLFQKAPKLDQSEPGVPQQIISPNVPLQQYLAQTMVEPISRCTNTNTQDGQLDNAQKLSQPSLPWENFPEIAAEVAQVGNAPQEIMSPEGAFESSTQPATNTKSAPANRDRNREQNLCFDLLDATRLFALQAPQWIQRLEKLHFVRDSLSQDEEAFQTHQEQRSGMEGEIHKLETLCQDLLQHMPEEEKNDLVSMKERTVASKRRKLEEHDARGEMFRVVRENRAEIETIMQQVRGLKASVPDAIKALQGLEAFLIQLGQ